MVSTVLKMKIYSGDKGLMHDAGTKIIKCLFWIPPKLECQYYHGILVQPINSSSNIVMYSCL